MKIFITGGTGFIGSEVLRQAIAAGHEVSVLTRSGQSEALVRAQGARPVPGDLMWEGSWQESAAQADWVLHLAQPQTFGGRVTRTRALKYRALRLEMDKRLLESVSSRARKIVYVGGTSYYGDVGKEKVDEDARPNPKGWGPFIKPAIEALPGFLAQGLPLVEAFPGYVYGYGSWFKEYVLYPLWKGKTLSLLTRDPIVSPIHVRDCARALLFLLEHGEVGHRYFVVDDTPLPNELLLKYAALAMGRPYRARRIPVWVCKLLLGGLITESLLSNSALSNARLRALGFVPEFPSAREGIPEVVRYAEEVYRARVAREANRP